MVQDVTAWITTAIEKFQMSRPGHPPPPRALGRPQAGPPGPRVGAPGGRRPALDLRRAAHRRAPPRRRPRAHGGSPRATRCSSTRRTAPRWCWRWLACATLGAVAVTTNTKSVGAEMTYFAEHTGAVAAITQPQFAAMVAEAAPALKWIAVTADNSGDAADGRGGRPRLRGVRRAVRGRGRLDAAPGRADAPVRDHVHLGDDEPPQGRRAHPRQRGVGEPHRPAQHRPHAPTTPTSSSCRSST